MKLYELTAQFKSLELLESSDELPAEVIRDTLDGLTGDIQLKATNVGLFIRNMEATVEAIHKAAEAMDERANRMGERAESLKQYLLLNMQACGITKIESEYFSLIVRNNPPTVIIDNVADIPAEFMRQALAPPPPPPAPDKKAIGDALKAGKEVTGCHIEQRQRLEIKV